MLAPPRPDWRDLRYRLEFLAFRAAGGLFRSLGLERASALSGFLWRHGAPWSKRHARALAHLEAAFPEKSAAERERIARAMWDNLGRTFAEAFFLREIVDGERIAYHGLDALDRWATDPAGGRVACAAHLGNWELAIAGLTARGMRPCSVYQRVKNPRVDAAVLSMRSFLYPGGLVPKGPTVARQFLRIVREGGTIGMLADLRDLSGVAVRFMGRSAPSTAFPAVLALSAGTPVLVSTMRRLPGVRFVQGYELVELPDTGDRKRDVETVTQNIQAVYERFIREWPEQWMWAHRRWG